MSKEFERENRYIVLKRKHLGQLPDALQIRLKPALEDAASLLPKFDCVVVESDWPEYEPTWAAIERRVTGDPAWEGIGPPPAGTVCEIRSVLQGSEWAEATIAFASRNVIVWDWAGEPSINGLCTSYAHSLEIRPIPTPEQIAAEERKRIEEEIQSICTEGENCGVPFFAALYDAGYRKQVSS